MDINIYYDEFYKLLKNYTNIFYKNLLDRYNECPNYLEFIYLKGLFLLKNIYILLLLYSENISEVILITEKAYIYYIEFLIQINIINLNLELSLNDAIIFTYKKTILSYNKQVNNINKLDNNIDYCLNSLCNLFYIIDNRNFINNYTIDEKYCDLFVARKINNINKLDKKLKYILNYNNSNVIIELNNILNNLKDNIEKKINNISNKDIQDETNINTEIINSNILNKVNNLLENLTHDEKFLTKSKSYSEFNII